MLHYIHEDNRKLKENNTYLENITKKSLSNSNNTSQ